MRYYLLTLTLLFSAETIVAGPITISPIRSTVSTNHATFTVTGAGSRGVQWSISPDIGSLAVLSATQVLYSPPAPFIPQDIRLTATDVATPTNIATAIIALTASSPITVTVHPATLHLTAAGQQNFTATVTGTSNTAVTWSLTPHIGTVSESGEYTAPAVIASTKVTLTATSQANATRSSTAQIQLDPFTPLTFTTQANGLQSIVFKGTNFNYPYGENLLTSVTSVASSGQITTTQPACTGAFTASAVTKTCMNGSLPLAYSVTYAATDASTLNATIQITNNSPTDSITECMFSTLGVQLSQFNAGLSQILSVDGTNPISYVNYTTGQWAIWNTHPSPDVRMGVSCGWTNFCKNQPRITDIAPGQTKSASFSLRFNSDPAIPSITLAPEAYSDFAASYPSVVNWPDRRPIMAWFIADTSKRSVTNPRGYLQEPKLDVSDIPGFRAAVLAQAQTVISAMRDRPVQPQGLIVWDLEGEEFIQPTTYVGDPRVFSEGYAPEMNAVADQLFALFKSAGYKTGITLRPQQLQWGTQLPGACQYNASNDFKDYYILVNGGYLQSFYACYDPNGVNWSLIPQGNGGQTFYLPTQPASVTALLMSKVAYAHARWGTTLYYVDTAVWHGGAPIPADTFRQLHLAFPDCIFIPEQSYIQTMGVSQPFSDPKNASAPRFAPVNWRYVYPNGGLGTYLANCQGSCWTTNYDALLIGQRIGDMALYPQPRQMSSEQLQSIESMILHARSQTSLITVTDTSSGAGYSYQGAADTVYRYPVKMRVYFGATPAQAAASTLYCESGQWQGENTCSLNLSGLASAQIRYYDFAGKVVLAEAARPR